MIHTTTWRPDTCDCEIEYEWDDILPEKDRMHTPTNIKKCVVHQDTNSHKEHYDKIIKENQRKNKVFGKLLEISALTEDVFDDEGGIHKKLKPGIKYNWSFDANRNLEVEIIGTKPNDKVNLIDYITEFGGKVILK